MGAVKLSVIHVLLLCMICGRVWMSCEAKGKENASGLTFLFSRRMLLEIEDGINDNPDLTNGDQTTVKKKSKTKVSKSTESTSQIANGEEAGKPLKKKKEVITSEEKPLEQPKKKKKLESLTTDLASSPKKMTSEAKQKSGTKSKLLEGTTDASVEQKKPVLSKKKSTKVSEADAFAEESSSVNTAGVGDDMKTYSKLKKTKAKDLTSNEESQAIKSKKLEPKIKPKKKNTDLEPGSQETFPLLKLESKLEDAPIVQSEVVKKKKQTTTSKIKNVDVTEKVPKIQTEAVKAKDSVKSQEKVKKNKETKEPSFIKEEPQNIKPKKLPPLKPKTQDKFKATVKSRQSSEHAVIKSTVTGHEDDDDEYGEFMQDFVDLHSKFQDTASKVADHVGPNIQMLSDTSKVYFSRANKRITDSFSPIVGNTVAPLFASLISYGLVFIPLALVVVLLEHIRAIFSLQKLLLFVNIYLAAYFATLLVATFIIGEPMTFFYKSSTSGYVHLQLLQGLGYIVYLILQTFDVFTSCALEAPLVKATTVLQWFVAVTIGFHYYVTVFHRAMALKGPHTSWKVYGVYSVAFFVLCLFARLKRSKKEYTPIGDSETDKKN